MHPSSATNSRANFWLRLSTLLEFVLMELDPLHSLLGHSTNTTIQVWEHRRNIAPLSEVRNLHLSLFWDYPASTYSSLQLSLLLFIMWLRISAGFSKDPASYSQGIYLRLITWKFLKYQVILNHNVLPQENCFTYIKYIRLSKSPLLQNLFISKCHLLLGGFFHEINGVRQRSHILLYWYFSMTPNFVKESHAETICFATEMV